ncbi:MAG: adenylate/guanylate cyclase domain-containing protein [Deltaproteobacteria bacterium]|nr:adenylate/guanylate cyclase domain-containing protein [Deltaproteobacteria bacterium]
MKQILEESAKDAGSLKYVRLHRQEIGELFGDPLPRLPHGDEGADGRYRIHVDFFASFGLLVREWLQSASQSVSESVDLAAGEDPSGKLLDALTKVGVRAVLQGRRNGLYNLFFLSLSKVFAEAVNDFYSRGGRKPYHKFLLHPALSALLVQVHQRVRQEVETTKPGAAAFHLGTDFNDSLLRAVLYDQLSCVTTEREDVTVENVLGICNPRFPLALEGFREIYRILRKRLQQVLDGRRESGREELETILGVEDLSEQSPAVLLNQPGVLRYLFLDYENVGKPIRSSRLLRGQGISYAFLCTTYLDLITVLKRNEVIQLLKRRVEILSDRQAARSEELYSAGSLYRFFEEGRILNDAREVTTVFLDLRGFTSKSEEAISAEELTDQLYALFDPIVPLVHEFNGEIDKFTGDGMMITFGVGGRKKADPLNALRLAIRVQENVRALRSSGKTEFEMGISIHSGTVFVAHFFAGDESVDRTVIGRNVNIAGRLSSAGDLVRHEREKQEFDDLVNSLSLSLGHEEDRSGFLKTVRTRKNIGRPISGVSVDGEGNLYNQGVVVSHQTVETIGKLVTLQSGEDQEMGFLYFRDPVLDRTVSLYYVGDVKFKGVESAFPVYAVLL